MKTLRPTKLGRSPTGDALEGAVELGDRIEACLEGDLAHAQVRILE